ncbi:hypothetical protein ACIOG8_27400 [Streptomyces erythrochromogenes]|uniref:hypothetical protein n=1 Tax=Streptomyces erythrochromogenes TaxID=285574 RepID=UPI0038161C05
MARSCTASPPPVIVDPVMVMLLVRQPATGDQHAANAPRAEQPVDRRTTHPLVGAYVLEWTPHHLELIAHLPHARIRPPEESLTRSRAMPERIAGAAFPTSFTDRDALLVGTGRSAPTDTQRTELRDAAVRFPLVQG